MKITTSEAIDMYSSLVHLAKLSDEKDYKKLNSNSNLFYRIALMIKKLKPNMEAYDEQSDKMRKACTEPIHKLSEKELDEDGNPKVVFNGYIYTAGKDEYFAKLKEMGTVEIDIENPILFKESELKPMLSANDYIALEKILEIDKQELDTKKKKSSK